MYTTYTQNNDIMQFSLQKLYSADFGLFKVIEKVTLF